MRRRSLLAVPLAAVMLAACTGAPVRAPDTASARAALAPSGALRIGVYPGSPTSMIRAPDSTEMRGISVDIGRELARRLGVPAEVIVFDRVAEVVDALAASRVDMTITNATPARAQVVEFAQPLLGLELGYLVLPGAPVTSIDTVDRDGIRIGVTQGSTSQSALGRRLTHATIVPAPSLKAAQDLLRTRAIDAYATNKAILFEMSDALPGARVLDGRWGLEHLAIAVPKGRDAGMPFLRRFVEEVRDDGQVQRAARRAGLRGTAPPDAR